MSVINNFFEDEDDSLESNSDDSGNDDGDENDELTEDTDEIYKRYFGGSSWKGFSDIRTSMVESQSTNSSRLIHHRSIGPSSDMLQPVVTLNVVVHEKKNIRLAEGWKLGRWDNGARNIDANPESKPQNNFQNLTQVLVNRDISPKKGTSSFSRTMSVPDLSLFSVDKKTMGDPPFRENMEESMTFLNNLHFHQQQGSLEFPTSLLSPPDSKICKLKNSTQPLSLF